MYSLWRIEYTHTYTVPPHLLSISTVQVFELSLIITLCGFHHSPTSPKQHQGNKNHFGGEREGILWGIYLPDKDCFTNVFMVIQQEHCQII